MICIAADAFADIAVRRARDSRCRRSRRRRANHDSRRRIAGAVASALIRVAGAGDVGSAGRVGLAARRGVKLSAAISAGYANRSANIGVQTERDDLALSLRCAETLRAGRRRNARAAALAPLLPGSSSTLGRAARSLRLNRQLGSGNLRLQVRHVQLALLQAQLIGRQCRLDHGCLRQRRQLEIVLHMRNVSGRRHHGRVRKRSYFQVVLQMRNVRCRRDYIRLELRHRQLRDRPRRCSDRLRRGNGSPGHDVRHGNIMVELQLRRRDDRLMGSCPDSAGRTRSPA